MKYLSIFIAGLLFSAGLIISGMINPTKVLAFLDIFGDWDPSLAFVLMAAVGVNMVGLRLTLRRRKPLFNEAFSVPVNTSVDTRLILGAIIFGIGWGLVGFCPGPAVAALTAAPSHVAGFTIAMLIGMYTPRLWSQCISRYSERDSQEGA